jgi:chromosome partitioning protein
MNKILIFSGKGGAMKTGLCRELAVAGCLQNRRVAIVDLDAQKGLTQWYGRRAAKTPSLIDIGPDGGKLRDDPAFDELIIDLPPGVPTYVAKLIATCDAVLVPCRPSPDDLSAAAGVVGLLAKHPRWAFVLTQTLPRSRLSDGALRQLAALGRVAPVTLGLRQEFPIAAIDGRAAVEFPETKSAVEVMQLRAYVDSLLES